MGRKRLLYFGWDLHVIPLFTCYSALYVIPLFTLLKEYDEEVICYSVGGIESLSRWDKGSLGPFDLAIYALSHTCILYDDCLISHTHSLDFIVLILLLCD